MEIVLPGLKTFTKVYPKRLVYPVLPVTVLTSSVTGNSFIHSLFRYSFGWESQLLETGFLAAFLCPVLSLRQVPRSTPTSMVVIWGFRWLIFRIMLGAVSVKEEIYTLFEQG